MGALAIMRTCAPPAPTTRVLGMIDGERRVMERPRVPMVERNALTLVILEQSIASATITCGSGNSAGGGRRAAGGGRRAAGGGR